MKYLINLSLLVVGIATLAPSAHALRSYATLDCKNDKYQMRQIGTYPIGGYYVISIKDADPEYPEENEFYILPSDNPDVYGKEELAGVPINYREVFRRDFDRKENNDGCYENYSNKSEIKIVLEKISPEASLKLGLAKNEVLSFSCEEGYGTPTDKNCDD